MFRQGDKIECVSSNNGIDVGKIYTFKRYTSSERDEHGLLQIEECENRFYIKRFKLASNNDPLFYTGENNE